MEEDQGRQSDQTNPLSIYPNLLVLLCLVRVFFRLKNLAHVLAHDTPLVVNFLKGNVP